jgi:hypothetical protein
MARPPKLNQASPEVIAENFLKEDAIPDAPKIVIAKGMPEIRRIEFLNGRDPGQALHFHYHSKTHPLHHYTLYHGQHYDLPVEVIEHLESCAETIYAYKKGLSGHPEMYVSGKKYIFQCRPVKGIKAA